MRPNATGPRDGLGEEHDALVVALRSALAGWRLSDAHLRDVAAIAALAAQVEGEDARATLIDVAALFIQAGLPPR